MSNAEVFSGLDNSDEFRGALECASADADADADADASAESQVDQESLIKACAISYIYDIFGVFKSKKDFRDLIDSFEPGHIFSKESKFSLVDGACVKDVGPDDLVNYADPRWSVVYFQSQGQCAFVKHSSAKVADVLTMRLCRSCGFAVDPLYQLTLLMEGFSACDVHCEECWAYMDDGTFSAKFPSVEIPALTFFRSAEFMSPEELEVIALGPGKRNINKSRILKASQMFKLTRERTMEARAQIKHLSSELEKLRVDMSESIKGYLSDIATHLPCALITPAYETKSLIEIINHELEVIRNMARDLGQVLKEKQSEYTRFKKFNTIPTIKKNNRIQFLNISISSYNFKVQTFYEDFENGAKKTRDMANFLKSECIDVLRAMDIKSKCLWSVTTFVSEVLPERPVGQRPGNQRSVDQSSPTSHSPD